jgi:hypothetical protein
MARWATALALVMIFSTQGLTNAQSHQPALTEDQAYKLGAQAYVYAYPLVLMELTKRVMTNRGLPLNRFFHAQTFPTPEAKTIIRPNVDTLYSTAWLDLSEEPVILSVSDTGGRYYLVQLLDAWTETFASPGARTTGTKANDFAIVGPAWKGRLPEGVREIRSPTNVVWALGRTQTNGASDYEHVHQIQRGFKLTRLSDWGKSSTSPSMPSMPRDTSVDMSTPPQQVARMDARTFFKAFADALKTNAPHEADAPMLAQLKAIGIEAGKDFEATRLGPDVIKGLERAVTDAPKQIAAGFAKRRTVSNGWAYSTKIGKYGTAYIDRAAIAMFGLGALEPEDAVYGFGSVDAEGQSFNGGSRYVLHFDKSALPPVQAFWSVTLYGPDGFFAANAINRYAIGDRDKLAFNQDGSLDIYIQSDRPDAAKESNWLPAPEGEFNLAMRLYWPKSEVMSGAWKPPAVRRVQ